MLSRCIILRVVFRCRLEVEQRRSSPKAFNRESSTCRHLASRQLTQFVNLIICMRTRPTSISPLTPRRISIPKLTSIGKASEVIPKVSSYLKFEMGKTFTNTTSNA